MASGNRTAGIGWALLVGMVAGCSSSGAESEDFGQAEQSITQPNLNASARITSSWADGYCADVNITNSGSATASTWTVVLELNAATLRNSWNGNFAGTGSRRTVTPVGWNASVAPGGTQTFGYCASFKAGSTNYKPTVISPLTTPPGGGGGGTGGAAGGGGAAGSGGATTGGAGGAGGTATGGGGAATGGGGTAGGGGGAGGSSGAATGGRGRQRRRDGQRGNRRRRR